MPPLAWGLTVLAYVLFAAFILCVLKSGESDD